jgi:hypothetical protein
MNAIDRGKRVCATCGTTEKVNGAVRIDGELKPVCYGCLIGIAHSVPETEESNHD